VRRWSARRWRARTAARGRWLSCRGSGTPSAPCAAPGGWHPGRGCYPRAPGGDSVPAARCLVVHALGTLIRTRTRCTQHTAHNSSGDSCTSQIALLDTGGCRSAVCVGGAVRTLPELLVPQATSTCAKLPVHCTSVLSTWPRLQHRPLRAVWCGCVRHQPPPRRKKRPSSCHRPVAAPTCAAAVAVPTPRAVRRRGGRHAADRHHRLPPLPLLWNLRGGRGKRLSWPVQLQRAVTHAAERCRPS
jgi:hypothetical protein